MRLAARCAGGMARVAAGSGAKLTPPVVHELHFARALIRQRTRDGPHDLLVGALTLHYAWVLTRGLRIREAAHALPRLRDVDNGIVCHSAQRARSGQSRARRTAGAVIKG